MEQDETKKKIEEYERFIDEKLKVDLKKILDLRDQIYDQIAKYVDLRNKIQLIQEQNLKELKTMINLGSEFYVQAKVDDTSRVIVNVGLGFHVEFTLDEALEFIAVKEKHLSANADKLTASAAEIKTRIKLIYHGVSELMKLPK